MLLGWRGAFDLRVFFKTALSLLAIDISTDFLPIFMLLTTSGTLLDAVDDTLVADRVKLVPSLVVAIAVALFFSGVTFLFC